MENKLKTRKTFNLDNETSGYLEELKWTLRCSKSEIIRKILKYFNKNREQLRKILEEG